MQGTGQGEHKTERAVYPNTFALAACSSRRRAGWADLAEKRFLDKAITSMALGEGQRIPGNSGVTVSGVASKAAVIKTSSALIGTTGNQGAFLA